MLTKIRINNDGFTIIELMVVICIVGILAAIAISNFISHRNKAFCTAGEKDAHTVAAGIAEYFSMPSNQSVSKNSLTSGDKIYVAETLSGGNNWAIDTGSINSIQIIITDNSQRCPNDYQLGMTSTNNPTGYWKENTYIKSLGR